MSNHGDYLDRKGSGKGGEKNARDFRNAARDKGRYKGGKSGPFKKIVKGFLGLIAIIAIIAAMLLLMFIMVLTDPPQTGCDSINAGSYVPLKEGEPGPNLTIAAIALKVASDMNASEKVTLALFETGLVESGFKNYANDGMWTPSDYSGTPSTQAQLDVAALTMALPHDAVGSDHASGGFLQQQVGPGFGWGQPEDVMNPAYAAKQFLTRAINAEKNGGAMSAGRLAQAVQRSAFPDKYDQREADAKELMAKVGGIGLEGTDVDYGGGCSGDFTPGAMVNFWTYYQVGPDGRPMTANGQPNQGPNTPRFYTFYMPAEQGPRLKAVSAMLNMVNANVRYAWAGGNDDGPTTGSCAGGHDGCNHKGMDCSGFTHYGYAQAGLGHGGHKDFDVPVFPGSCSACQEDWMRAHGKKIELKDAQPGDLLFWDGHVTMFLGQKYDVKGEKKLGPIMVAESTDGDYAKVQDVYGSPRVYSFWPRLS